MPSLTASEIPTLVRKFAIPISLAEYDQVPTIYPQLGNVQGVVGPDIDADYQGTRFKYAVGIQQHHDLQIGQAIRHGNMGEGYTVQCAFKKKGIALEIPREILSATNPHSKIRSLVEPFAAQAGENAAVEKDTIIAGMFQKGTLTAGDTTYFDNSYVGNADSNRGFIYDGLPWFDTAHTLQASTSTYSNHTVSAALTATTLDNAHILVSVTNAINERGDRIRNEPDILLTSRSLEGTARRVLESELLPGGTDNDINHVKGKFRLVINPFLTDDVDAWWLGNSKRGLNIYDSGAPMFETEYDPRTQTFLVTSVYYFGAVVTDARRWMNANKAAS